MSRHSFHLDSFFACDDVTVSSYNLMLDPGDGSCHLMVAQCDAAFQVDNDEWQRADELNEGYDTDVFTDDIVSDAAFYLGVKRQDWLKTHAAVRAQDKAHQYKQLLEWLVMEFRHSAQHLMNHGEHDVAELMGGMTQRVVDIVVRVEDDSLCHSDCKGMYFCTLKTGHEGDHSEHGRLSWKD